MLLALDTSLETCSACLYDGRVIASRSEPMSKGHAERLMPMVEEVFKEAGVTPAQLTRIGVTIGPGSFTGLRVALSAARSMGIALQIPVIGISSLKCLLNGQRSPSLALIDARHSHCYAEIEGHLLAGLYDLNALAPFAHFHMVGSGAKLLGVEAETQIKIESVAALTYKAAPATHPAIPLYLKAADVTPQIKGRIALVV
jgi:tRNA threonylcarbamoyladenosine biosynthesis protein TsaB